MTTTTTRIALARSIAVLLLIQTALIALTAASASSQTDDHLADLPTSQLLAQADSLLSSGKGGDALELYNVIVERDGSSYVSRRAHPPEPNTRCPLAAARVGRACVDVESAPSGQAAGSDRRARAEMRAS